MAGENSIESALDAVAERIGEQITEAFGTLGDETRLAILLTLWDAQEPGVPVSEAEDVALSFSALRERLGRPDSGQFNYHLDKLVGAFVEQSDEGYTLKTPAARILNTIFAGVLTDPPSFEGESIDATCDLCGAPLVIDYKDGIRYDRCTSCEGIAPESENPPGMVSSHWCPPAGLLNRTPQEFYVENHIWTRHRIFSMLEGACPDCSGTVSTTFYMCEDHHVADGTPCEHCGMAGTVFEAMWLFVCDVCKNSMRSPGLAPILPNMAVRTFFFERGLDLEACMDTGQRKRGFDVIERIDVTSEDPLEVEVRAGIDGDRIEVTLDGEATVIDVTKHVQETA